MIDLLDRIRRAEAASHHELGANAENFADMNDRDGATVAAIVAVLLLGAALIFLAHLGLAALTATADPLAGRPY